MAKIKTQYQYEKEDRSIKKCESWLKTGKLSRDITVEVLSLLGFSRIRAKELVKQWEEEIEKEDKEEGEK